MLKIYHASMTRSLRVIWLCEELGLPIEVEPISFHPDFRFSEEWLARNPVGKVPVLEDGDFSMFESGAMVQYVLDRYGDGRLQPWQQQQEFRTAADGVAGSNEADFGRQPEHPCRDAGEQSERRHANIPATTGKSRVRCEHHRWLFGLANHGNRTTRSLRSTCLPHRLNYYLIQESVPHWDRYFLHPSRCADQWLSLLLGPSRR